MYKLNSNNLDLLNIGLVLNGEKNLSQLLHTILNTGMSLFSCDAGIIYLLENDMLHYTMLHTKSSKLSLSNLTSSEIPMMPIPISESNIYTDALRLNEIIFLPNVNNCHKYDLKSCMILDKRLNYQTISMVVVPLYSHDNEPLGILQLMNCMNHNNKIVSFSNEINFPLFYFATQAALAISNIYYTQEIKDLLYSFAEAMSAAIDERAPYNSTHSRNVAKYVRDFIAYYNLQYREGYVSEYFDENRIEQLYLAALLHDIGKLGIPIEIMNKSTRLSSLLDPLMSRFEMFRCYYKIDYLEQHLSISEYEKKIKELDQVQEFVLEINSATFLDDITLNKVKELSKYYYSNAEGLNIPFFTEAELECLSIKKGTLTQQERKIMESHVIITSKMLSRFNFKKHYANIPQWANSHHEFLDGSGYPNHLTSVNMPLDVRILCICDIYDALTATDRPYKKPMTVSKALNVLYDMAVSGKLDLSLVMIFTDMVNSKAEYHQ